MTAEELRLFKCQVRGFIKWICDGDEQAAGTHKESCKKVTKAKTFEEVQKVLAEYDDGTFLDLVQKGQL